MLTKEENSRLLDKRISSLNLEGKDIIAFDFDELVVPIHLTKEVLKEVSKPVDKKKLDELGSCSFEGILYLNSLIYGYNYNKYQIIRDNLAKKTKWKDNFNKIINDLSNKYSVIFISSGIKDISQAKLREIDFNPDNILATEFEIKAGKIAGSKLIISDELKGDVVRKLKEKYKVIAVGHSLGDKIMLNNAEVSISINSKIANLAKINISSAKELAGILDKI